MKDPGPQKKSDQHRYFDLVPPPESSSASNKPSKRLTFAANTAEEARDWAAALEKSISDLKLQQRHSYTFSSYDTPSSPAALKRGDSLSSLLPPWLKAAAAADTADGSPRGAPSSPRINLRSPLARTLSR